MTVNAMRTYTLQVGKMAVRSGCMPGLATRRLTRPGRRADVLEPGLQARDGPPGELRPRLPTPKGNTGQAHDIGLLRRQGQEPWPVAPDEQRRMGPLDGERLELMPPHVIVLA